MKQCMWQLRQSSTQGGQYRKPSYRTASRILSVFLSLLLVWNLFDVPFVAYAATSQGTPQTTKESEADAQPTGSVQDTGETPPDETAVPAAKGNDDEGEVPTESTAGEGQDSAQTRQTTDKDVQDDTTSEQADPEDDAEEADPLTSYDVYQDGMIHLATFGQLALVGTGTALTSTDMDEDGLGAGDVVLDAETQEPVTYAADGAYYLESDIEIPADGSWQFPDDFTGSFSGPTDADAERIYDSETDTIYIQNVYQLAILAAEDRAEMPVMMGDVQASTFGSGQMVLSDDEEQSVLTYDTSHRYVLSAAFDASREPLRMLLAASGDQNPVDGRDYFGQVTKEIGGTTYILIGDRQQLDAINNASDTESTRVCKPVYKVVQTRQNVGTIIPSYTDWETSSVSLVYPGDADLVDGLTGTDPSGSFADGDYSSARLYDKAYDDTHAADIPIYGRTFEYEVLGTTGGLTLTRTVVCTIGDNGEPDLSQDSQLGHNERVGNLTYTKDGHYIVFRDIDMTKGDQTQVDYGTIADGDWKPLMFSGNMYGVKAESPSAAATIGSDMQILLSGGSLDLETQRPTIANFDVAPLTLTQSGSERVDLGEQLGIGFFGTIKGTFNDSAVITDPASVQNLRLFHGVVTNSCTRGAVQPTLVNTLLTGLGGLVGLALDTLLSDLTGKPFKLRDMLSSLLNAREQDPTGLACGAFAGRIMADTLVKDCEADHVVVHSVATDFETAAGSAKVVGTGGFVGHVEGETQYEGLSGVLGALVDVLSGLLNLIPGLGLGDLITVLLDNALDIGRLIPVGYANPTLDGCTARSVTLNTAAEKIGVGGFAGDTVGARLTDCSVVDAADTVQAAVFGGGFVGVARDAVIEGTLSGLGVNVLHSLHPQSELIGCSIEGSVVDVSGGAYLGGFAGCQANSSVLDATIDASSSVTVSGTGDYVAGFTGRGQLGSLFTMKDYLATDADLLGTLSGLLTTLVGSGTDDTLLDVGGVAPSVIAGAQVLAPVTVSSDGSYVGGLVGRGDGMYVISSADVGQLSRYEGRTDLTAALTQRDNLVSHLVAVSGDDYVGGIAGYLTSASTGGLLGDTVGLGQFLGYTISDTTVSGNADEGGYHITACGTCGAGGIGWAVGGSVEDVQLLELASVSADNRAAGFVGATGPGDLVSGGGLDVSLLGISLLKIDNLLSLASGVRSTYERANVTGIADGFTVIENGQREDGSQTRYTAGGWAAEANSVRVVDSQVANLASVSANMADGRAGGFVASSSAGGLAGLVEDGSSINAVQLGQLLSAVPYLVPSYDGCSTTYVDGGYVAGDIAGGFTGEFQSGKVNTSAIDGENPISEQDYVSDSATGYTHGTTDEPWSVYNIDHVRGGSYAGGWGGKVISGSLASAGSGLSLLGGLSVSITATDLVGLASVYVPTITHAGVNSYSETQPGFSVYAAYEGELGADGEATGGYAGGFIGYGSGVQVSYSDVNKLRHGSVSEPASLTQEDKGAYARIGMEPDALESQDGSAYMTFGDFDADPENVPYAVAGARYAGGYMGHMDVGSAASLGGGLSLLGSSLSLTNVLDALSVVVSTVEHSNVYGAPGGFSVVSSSHINLHDGTYDAKGVGHAGGFAGKVSGGHIQDSNVDNFAYIVGEVSAGGYVGEMVPGDVASVLDSGSINLLGTNLSSVASLVQDFVPTIRNSQTTCVPCGGAVRAQSSSHTQADDEAVRGMAGGYVGHCRGGQIWGMSDDTWKDQNDGVSALGNQTDNPRIGAYTGPKRECAAIRIRSVFGEEYAGGFCGLMECGSTASTGGLSLLGGLVNASNLLGVLQAVYPTIRHGAVYGPLYGIDEATWNAWKEHVGAYGGFASELASASYGDLSSFEYGTHVVAGRHVYDAFVTTMLAGCAGGFVGAMHSGVIQDSSHAEDAKLVLAMRASGGFAGEMQTKGLAEFGTVSLLGDTLKLNLGNLVSVAKVFVPAISTSGSTGYAKGLRVGSTGSDAGEAARQAGVGCAGGYVGANYGGQIGIADDAAPVAGSIESGTWVRKLKEVKGTLDIGGFAGRVSAASVLTADTENASGGFLQGLLNSLVTSPNDLVDVLKATSATVKFAEVTAADDDWGIVVDGRFNESGQTSYAATAGGFAGSLEACVLGERRNDADTLTVNGLRGVVGGYYAGGFFGLADVGSVAQVGGSSSGGGASTTLLNLIQAGNVSVLDAFRTYIYHASVSGVTDGIRVYAFDESSSGTFDTYNVSGAAGGFGGGLMNGTVENSTVSDLNAIEAPNYAAGFIGHMGKNGGVTVDQAKITNDSLVGRLLSSLGLDLNSSAQLLNIVGATATSCSATGFADGFTVDTKATQVPIADTVAAADLTGSCAAGFAGYADISQIEDCHVRGLRYVKSPQLAAGFVGRGTVAYLADVDVSSGLVQAVLQIVNLLVKALYLPQAEQLNLVNADSRYFGLKLLADGDLLYVNLLGLKISVSLSKNDSEYEGSDAAIITIGSSTIKLPCNKDGIIEGGTPEVSISLIEGNRTTIKYSSVTGIEDGYDVFAGGATQNADGTDELGYAGGFVAFNGSGFLSHDRMYLCDVVCGTQNLVGPFVGHTLINSQSRPQTYLEGTDNVYPIYRAYDSAYTSVKTQAQATFGTATAVAADGASAGTVWNRYDVTHLDVIDSHGDLQGAVQTGAQTVPLEAYVSSAKAKLMDDTPLAPNGPGDTTEPDDLKDPCDELITLTVNKVWKGDLNNLAGTRPDEIVVYVSQVDVGTTPPETLVAAGDTPPSGAQLCDRLTLTLTAEANAQMHTEAWKASLAGLPVAYRVTVGEGDEATEELHYYRYYVHELSVSEYETSYTENQNTASVTVTNTYNAGLLPYLGGLGMRYRAFVMGFATSVMAVLAYDRYRRRKKGVTT